MAEDDDEELEEEELDEDGDEDDDDESSEKGGSKKILIILGLVLLLVIGGAAAAYFTGLMQPLIDMIAGSPEEQTTEEEVIVQDATFYDVPELLVNLSTGGRKASFLKMKISLELDNAADIPKIEFVMPRIVDNFQVYLRELRIEDLKGSAGMYRLREELLKRVSAAAAPVKVNDVLFKEMLVQ